ncbi:hypothetical protein L2E82_24744 [Cichorium intybus]|uniref:Uncharacterized protein n=2 Tax=Cichorium intybus TaxID=13427 RepID=A0ACB9E2C3_CICIN|nr:hypothetical protein L2E82_24739 [Cichorium intybus]KAI3752708.1 hypothetical protein L2E82_24744 [Cichorium intybus]
MKEKEGGEESLSPPCSSPSSSIKRRKRMFDSTDENLRNAYPKNLWVLPVADVQTVGGVGGVAVSVSGVAVGFAGRQ